MHLPLLVAFVGLLLSVDAKCAKSSKKHHKSPSKGHKSTPKKPSTSQYKLTHSYTGQNLLNAFNFATGPSDNGGSAMYNSYANAKSKGLVSVGKNGQVTLKVGSTSYQQERDSLRLVSKQTWNSGNLFIFDIATIPSACGVWPSLWMTGSNWPMDGEIDIIEGVHETTMNAMSTHTNEGCTQQTNGFSGQFMMTGVQKNNCNAYATSSQGCGVRSASRTSYGTPFNQQGGGVYAVNWGSTGISTYYFPRNAVPKDISSGSPNPAGWGTPENFVHPDSCNPANHFKNLMLVLNTNLCGTWPDGTWNQDMSYAGQSGSCAARTGYSSCQAYVQQHGEAFANAKWGINSMKIYQ